MATPFETESKRQRHRQTLLNISDLNEIMDLLKRHGYSGIHYIRLGLYLGLFDNTLRSIKANQRGDVSRCLMECLMKWLEQADMVMSVGSPTYDTLIQALREMGENDVADGIERERKIENWLKEGKVELKVTRINMHGAPGAGKTCSQHLLLNEPPPSSTDSTPVACPAVQATRISIDDKNKKWERVKREDFLYQLASHLEEARKETKHVKGSIEVDEDTMDLDIVPDLSDAPLNESAKNMEVIKKIADALATGKFRKLSTNWVYFIDSGGQPAYRELLPLFTRAAALNIITIDLTKGLDEKCQFQYRIDQNTSPINTNLRYSNCGIIRSTISSEAMLNSIEIPYVTDMPKHSHYLILGTRKELVPEKKLKEMNESLIKSSNLALKNVIWNIPQESIIFPVNTLLSAESKERKEASVQLCSSISNCRVEMMIELPIRLFIFEISLQIEAKSKKRNFLTREEVIKFGKSLRLDDESDIDVALRYLHNVTIILYYPAVLPNLVFVDPKPILDILSRLIAITYVNQCNLHLLADPPPSPDERDNLMKFGLFKEDLLAIIGKKIFNDDFKSSHMIKLLKHLHIIAKIENRKEGDYFFPCALPSYDALNPAPTEIQPLLIAWEINNRGTTTLAIPQGLFPLTIVHLLEQKDEVDFSPVGEGFYRYHDAMSLRVYKDYTIDIINRYTHIEIRFDGCKEFCPQIRELVTEAIEKSSNDLKVGKNHIFAFECPPPKSEQCYCIVKEDKSSTWCTRCRSHCKVLEAGDDSYRCWFSDCQLANPGAEEGLPKGPAETDIKRNGTHEQSAPNPTVPTTSGGIEKTNHPNGGATAVKTTHVHVPDPPDVSEWCPSMEDIDIKPENFTQELIADVNIILVTATDTEYCAVMGTGRKLREDDEGYTQVELDDGVTFNLVMYGTYKVAVIRTGQGPKKTETMLERIQAEINAQYVIAIGICYGMKQDKTNIGDTIVAERIMDTSSKRAAGDKLLARPQEYMCGRKLCNIFSQKQGFKQEKGDGTNVVIHYGMLVSENTLVASQEYKEDISEQISQALGGEMEGAGLMTAAEKRKYEGIVIKAIADWGNKDKELYRKWQKFAVVGAAKYVLYHLETTKMLKKKQLPIPHGGEANNED